MATKQVDKIKDKETMRVSLSLHSKDYQRLQLLAALSYKNNKKPTSVASTILTDFLHEIDWENLKAKDDSMASLLKEYNID